MTSSASRVTKLGQADADRDARFAEVINVNVSRWLAAAEVRSGFPPVCRLVPAVAADYLLLVVEVYGDDDGR